MSASIGVNLRVTGHCRQGGRKYMEDFFCVAYQQTEDEKDLEYAFCGIYDGHGGAEAAAFAKEHLMEAIIKHKNFWSDEDEDVLRAIKDGYIATHYAMWKEQEKWPKTASGLPSTAGTTASIAFIRRGKIYIGHVGDSGIILGYQEPGSPKWKAMPLTRDHKPENAEELTRIRQCGGKVVPKSGVPRVVWNRPKIGHQGPVRRSTPIDEIPFLAVARSLGDLWSYNSQINQFIVSPDPDCSVIQIDTNVHRCLIFGTDGLFNMFSPSMAVYVVQNAEIHNECTALDDCTYKTWMNPSKLLVEKALQMWHATKMRADNTSVVTLMLDPPGPPKSQILKDRKKQTLPDRGLKIVTRYENEPEAGGSQDVTILHEDKSNLPDESTSSVSSSEISSNFPLKERNFVAKPRESTSFDPREPTSHDKENSDIVDDSIQIHEISSSSNDVEVTEDEAQSKHNLRSCSTKKAEGEEPRPPKRKQPEGVPQDEVPPQKQQRKSTRLEERKSRENTLTKKLIQSQKILKKQFSKKKLKIVLKKVQPLVSSTSLGKSHNQRSTTENSLLPGSLKPASVSLRKIVSPQGPRRSLRQTGAPKVQ